MPTATATPNRYPGTCRLCGVRVPEGAGRLDGRDGSGRWRVTHIDRCPPVEARTVEARPAMPDVPAGYYAVPSLTGNNDLDFFRVDRPTEGRWAGYTFVKRVIGGRPDSPVRGTTARAALEAILAAGPAAASARYGRELGRCGVCNRHLTDSLSRALGIGPVCRGGDGPSVARMATIDAEEVARARQAARVGDGSVKGTCPRHGDWDPDDDSCWECDAEVEGAA